MGKEQAFRLFREEHNIHCIIDWMTRTKKSGWYVSFRGINGNPLNEENMLHIMGQCVDGYEVFPTYEEAQNAGLQYMMNYVKKQTIMKKEFVPYEQAFELKKLGFDEPCFGWYSGMEGNPFRQGYCETYSGIENCVKSPLYQQVFRWFREKYGVKVISIGGDDSKKYNYLIHLKDDTQVFGEKKDTYEEAELECLKKLIELVKNK